jgi:HAD superfamily hydrolase (TIGR01509 family)
MSAPAAAIFDNDGLFLDTEDAWTRAEETLFRRYGLTFTYEHKLELIGSSHHVAASKLETMLSRPGEGAGLMAELDALVMDEALRDVAPRPGAVDLVRALRAAGTPVGLASNSPRHFIDRVLATSGTAECFDAIVSAHDVGAPKPAPDVYLAAAAALSVEPQSCVALEDSPTGVAAAVAAGMRVVGVPYLVDIVLDADIIARSLADPEVWAACGL